MSVNPKDENNYLDLANLCVDAGHLDQAVSVDPGFPDAHFFRGMILFKDRNNPAAAIPEFETYLASNPAPDTVQAVQDVLNQARQAVASTTTTPATTTSPTVAPG